MSKILLLKKLGLLLDEIRNYEDSKVKDKIEEYENEILKLKESLKEYIMNANKEIDNVNIFSKINLSKYKLTTKKELDKQFELCYKYIINYIKNKVLFL